MKRSKSLGLIRTSKNYSSGGEGEKKNKKIVYKLSGSPRSESKVLALKRFWNIKASEGAAAEVYGHLERKHKRSLQAVLAQPFEEKAVLECIRNMLSSSEHPYGMVVAGFGKEIINSFESHDMDAALVDIKSRLETFSTSMASTAFLNYSDILAKVTLHEFSMVCKDALYEVLLSQEPNVILDYYHAKFAQQDQLLCALSEAVAPVITPASLHVDRKFWLIPQKNGTALTPYSVAIGIFQQFPNKKSPLDKIEVLKNTARAICSSVEQFWNVHRGEFGKKEDPSISADDLVAIFSYIILKSKVQLLYSESEYMYALLSDRNRMGETGYLITTLQICCLSLISLNPAELTQS